MRKVISRKNLPTNIPIIPAVVTFLALDHWYAPEWAYGVAGLVWVILIIGAIIEIANEKIVRLDQ